MRTKLRTSLLLFLLVAVASVAADSPSIPEAVKANIQNRVDLRLSPGMVVGVINAEGTVYFSYGSTALESGTPMNEDTVFEIGSISKVFTGMLLAWLVEQGELALEDPVSSHLPEGVTMPERGGTPIRLVDLSTHRSGFPKLPDNMKPADLRNPYADYTVDQLYAYLSGHRLRRDPGDAYEYSNLAAGLLGHVLELKTGKSYEELVHQVIASKLGMKSTTITLSPKMLARTARPHTYGQEVKLWDLPVLAGAGAIRSTARDMLAFLSANMSLRSTTLDAAMQTSRQERADAGSPEMKMGLGWHILTGGAHRIVWHNGGTGGHHSFVGFREDGSLGVVVLANSENFIDDIGMHLLDPGMELAERKPPKKIPLFKKD